MKSFNELTKKIEQYLIGITLLIIAAILFINIVLRLFNASLIWSEEVARYAIVWVTFVGVAVCVYKGAHIGVDVILNLFKERGKKNVILITLIMSILFTLAFTYYSLQFTLKIASTNQLSSTLGIPMVYVYASMPVGGALTLIRYIQEFVSKLKEGEKN